MAVLLNPYLGFRDNAREALEFYHEVFGGDLEISTYASMGMGAPEESEKVMHGMIRSDDLALMAADTPNEQHHTPGSSISLSLSGDDDAVLRGYWEALSASGQELMPLNVAPWGDSFGMCIDKFGISWMVNIAGKK